ncbi:MAG TPA: SAVED domain-containing protein [Kribbellaceae bacterium]|nr:SAVED domain-containing protein [Kribbellaceae bacterium]
MLCDEDLDLGGDLALAIGLTHDPTSQVRDYITGAGLPVAKLLTLSTPGGATPTSVPGPGWAADWVRHARERARGVAGKLRPPRVHLFLAAPAGVALFLGHDWNLMPDTTVYDHVGFDDYVPTMTFRG